MGNTAPRTRSAGRGRTHLVHVEILVPRPVQHFIRGEVAYDLVSVAPYQEHAETPEPANARRDNNETEEQDRVQMLAVSKDKPKEHE